ncbi:transcription antitermination factor NusB [Orenia metallireducens]|uniref:Transcription antitermination protein NusB n=1 Tax=Orenia metallireducens TaxID=1413210 RepID=A0A1C0A9K6_9FIRM|nr:transcription antitermination factor NusB [Orenia metallireducens]OCL26959.1 transcription antitermination factor NusB [Orenia metallireducens]
MTRELNRHEAREVAVQLLYQMDINQESLEENLEVLKSEQPELILEESFLLELLEGTYEKLEEIDNTINNNVIDWKVDRMGKVDRNIIRLAMYEILFKDDIPVAVSINEAVELAKSFSDEKSANFINGILGKLVDALDLEREEGE